MPGLKTAMSKPLVFDIETDGLLDTLTRVHCLVIVDPETDDLESYADQPGYRPIAEGLERLRSASLLIGHNIIGFDIPALRQVYGDHAPTGPCFDTMVAARLLWPDLTDIDTALRAKGLPPAMFRRHSLEAWGYRLGILKDQFVGPWDHWSPEMHAYMEQDGRVTAALYRRIIREGPSKTALDLEHGVAEIISRQERYGFAFDERAAAALYADLVRERDRLAEEVKRAFGVWYEPDGKDALKVPKRPNARLGISPGAPYTAIRRVEFDPNSRVHAYKRLIAVRGWQPTEFTDSGQPKVDETVLMGLPWPEAKALADYYMVQKRLGALAEGDEAWLRHVRRGRIHGAVNTNGALTGRMTHSTPNLAQVPAARFGKDGQPILGAAGGWGFECRSLFIASPGRVLVGCDADALELRCLAHFLAIWDGGEFARSVDSGRKEDGTDPHSRNARIWQTTRDRAKTALYALIYGAGNWKLGEALGQTGSRQRVVNRGKAAREALMKDLPAFKNLVDLVERQITDPRRGARFDSSKSLIRPGYLLGLDGRKLYPRNKRSALNTLLQSAGAVLMKTALVILDRRLREDLGYRPGVDYEFVANVHDEWQIECLPEIAETVGQTAKDSISEAGRVYSFRCPLTGNYKVGRSWAETH